MLGCLMSQGAPQVAAMPFDVAKWRGSSSSAAECKVFEFLEDEASQIQFVEAAGPQESPGPLLQSLLAAEPGRARRRVMEAHLQKQVSQTLRLAVSRVDLHKPLKSYGMDSLTALELRNRLETTTGLSLSATLIWNYPTIAQLTDHLVQKMATPLDAPVVAHGSEIESARGASDMASKEGEELERLLEEVESLSHGETRKLLGGETTKGEREDE